MSRRVWAALVTMLAAVCLFYPSLALACPACTGKEPGGGAKIAAIGVMILLPFCVIAVVVRVLKKVEKQL